MAMQIETLIKIKSVKLSVLGMKGENVAALFELFLRTVYIQYEATTLFNHLQFSNSLIDLLS